MVKQSVSIVLILMFVIAPAPVMSAFAHCFSHPMTHCADDETTVSAQPDCHLDATATALTADPQPVDSCAAGPTCMPYSHCAVLWLPTLLHVVKPVLYIPNHPQPISGVCSAPELRPPIA